MLKLYGFGGVGFSLPFVIVMSAFAVEDWCIILICALEQL